MHDPKMCVREGRHSTPTDPHPTAIHENYSPRLGPGSKVPQARAVDPDGERVCLMEFSYKKFKSNNMGEK